MPAAWRRSSPRAITIITHENNEDFLEDALAAPRTLVGDALAKANRKPNVEGVGDRRVLKGANRTIELHHVRDLEHNDGMLIAYLPNEKILFSGRLQYSESSRTAGRGQSVADGAGGEPRAAEAGLHDLHHRAPAGSGSPADESGPDGRGRTRDELAEGRLRSASTPKRSEPVRSIVRRGGPSGPPTVSTTQCKRRWQPGLRL